MFTTTKLSKKLQKGGETMRKTALLVLAGLVLSSVAFAATTYTETIYGLSGAQAENWIAMRGVPFNPDPQAVFGGTSLIDDGLLNKLNAPMGGVDQYYSYQEPGGPFGNMLLGDGYVVYVNDGAEHTFSYSGVDDGVPSDPTNPTTTMTDMWISLPGITGANGGSHWIGHPFNHNTLWTDVMVTDGTTTIPVTQAVADGWLEGSWQYMNAAFQGVEMIDPDGINGSPNMMPGHMYIVNTFKPNLALIIPSTVSTVEW